MRVAVVTGANRGLGYEVARQLARRGTHVVLTARDPSKGRAAAECLVAEGGDVAFQPLDIEDRSSIGALRDFLTSVYGHIDVLINNAGAHPTDNRCGREVSTVAMRQAFGINCLGTLQVIQELLPLLCAGGSGRIINVSTILASASRMDQLPGAFFAYRVSKAALNAVTAAMAVEIRDQGVSVNAVHPGWLKTSMGGPDAPDSVEDGAARVVHLALDVPASVSGKLFAQGAVVPW